METIKIENITEEEFDNYFKRLKNHIDINASFDGYMFETYGEEVAYVFEMSKKNRVVTIIEGDDGEKKITFFDSKGVKVNDIITTSTFCYLTGFHYVNRCGYFVLDKPYEYEFEVNIY